MKTRRALKIILPAAALLALWLPCAAPSAAGEGEPVLEAPVPDTPVPEAPVPDAPIEALWSRGQAAFTAGDLDTALRHFDAALAADQRRARSWNYVGGVHFAQGDHPRALQEFQTAHALDPTDVRICNNLGTVRERLGDYDGAERAYAQAALADPSYAVTQRNLGILYARHRGDPEAARRAWLRYLELAPNAADAALIRAELAALPAR